MPTSPVSAYRRSHAFRSMVELNTAVADFGAARPMLYTTVDSSKQFDKRYIYNTTMKDTFDGIASLPAEFLKGDRGLSSYLPNLDALSSGMFGVSKTMNEEMNKEHVTALHTSFDSVAQQERLAYDLNAGRLDPRSVRIDPATGLPVFDA